MVMAAAVKGFQRGLETPAPLPDDGHMVGIWSISLKRWLDTTTVMPNRSGREQISSRIS